MCTKKKTPFENPINVTAGLDVIINTEKAHYEKGINGDEGKERIDEKWREKTHELQHLTACSA